MASLLNVPISSIASPPPPPPPPPTIMPPPLPVPRPPWRRPTLLMPPYHLKNQSPISINTAKNKTSYTRPAPHRKI